MKAESLGSISPNPVARDAAAQHAAAVASACEELVASAVASAQAVARELSSEVILEGAPSDVATTAEVEAAESPAEADAITRESDPNNLSRKAAGTLESGATTAATSAVVVPIATKKESNLPIRVAPLEDSSISTTAGSAPGTLADSATTLEVEVTQHEDMPLLPLELVHEDPPARASRFRIPDKAAAGSAKKGHQDRCISDLYHPQGGSRWHMEAESPWSARRPAASGREAVEIDEQGRSNLQDLPVECTLFAGLLPWWLSCIAQAKEALPWHGQAWQLDCQQEPATEGQMRVVRADHVKPDPGGVQYIPPFSRQPYPMPPPTPVGSYL